jgi:hypothetical protein
MKFATVAGAFLKKSSTVIKPSEVVSSARIRSVLDAPLLNALAALFEHEEEPPKEQ